MSELEERRNPHTKRVDMTTLVDICLQDGTLSPFQGESANVSGRGMHVRTSHLPEIGDELVCRFEHESKEILVEGRVAWRAEGEDSGEFGIQFTALDASSAELLRSLGEREVGPRFGAARLGDAARELSARAVSASRPPSRLFSLDDEEEEDVLAPGARVRLHIDGLGAPMKAAVQDGSRRKVKVGSSLEFLKVGRSLEIEDVTAGEKRGAHVDSVNVVMNPSTSIPELVVMLRYDGITPTPAPAATRDGRSSRDGASAAREEEEEDFEPAEPAALEAMRPAAEAIRARLESTFRSAGQTAERAFGALGDVFDKTRGRVDKALHERKKTARVRAAATAPSERRRTTAAPAHLRSSLSDAGVRTRPSARPNAAHAKTQATPKRGRLTALATGAFVLFAGSALALRGFASNEENKDAAETAPVEVATNQAPTAAPEALAPPQKAPPVSADGIVADVPLFGPKAMATAEAARPERPELGDAEAEKLAAAATVEDEAFAEEPEAPKPEAAWGRGKMHLPTIHRIRLDGEGAEVVGAVDPTGFTVVVPGRKAMESGRTIEKRDRRFVQVKASNTARGASVRFEFRGAVPGYRVRLKKDYVEFLISAPADSVAGL